MACKLIQLLALVLLIGVAAQLGPQIARGQAGTEGEVATLSGTVANGGTIPLPTYRDGTTAAESECRWTVGLGFMSGPVLRAMDEIHCSAPTRTVSVYACNGSPTCSNIQPGVANYLIIATRDLRPTQSSQGTWGNLKPVIGSRLSSRFMGSKC